MIASLVMVALGETLSLGAGVPPIELVRVTGHGAVREFWIGKYETTEKQFEAFIRATGYDGSDHPSSKTSEPFLMDWKNGKCPQGKDKYPASYINWHHAKAFCAWLAKKSGRDVHLPTDAEWSLAAMGAEGRKYPWGNTWSAKRCNLGGTEDGFEESAPVGSFKLGATPEGIFDMAGNIWEWSAEGHLRGGPWCMGPDRVESADIASEDTERADDKFGLRVAVSM